MNTNRRTPIIPQGICVNLRKESTELVMALRQILESSDFDQATVEMRYVLRQLTMLLPNRKGIKRAVGSLKTIVVTQTGQQHASNDAVRQALRELAEWVLAVGEALFDKPSK